MSCKDKDTDDFMLVLHDDNTCHWLLNNNFAHAVSKDYKDKREAYIALLTNNILFVDLDCDLTSWGTWHDVEEGQIDL